MIREAKHEDEPRDRILKKLATMTGVYVPTMQSSEHVVGRAFVADRSFVASD